jgi:uncharacterized damage-inducible protein DinB
MNQLLTPESLWNYWEGHRRLTLRTLQVFPEDQLKVFQIGEMRTFADLMTEIIQVEESTFSGLQSGVWAWEPKPVKSDTKADLLEAFAHSRAQAKAIYDQLEIDKLLKVEKDAWGMTSTNFERLMYLVDNEIHHRAQGYVYLRQLGLEPPAFYDRH